MPSVESTMLPLGTEAPPIRLPDVRGGMWDLDEQSETAALLVMFLCNHCPYVKRIADGLGELTRRWMDLGVTVVAVQSNDVDVYPDDAPDLIARDMARHGYEFPYLYDESQQVALAYRAACTPDFFLFDADHRLVYRGQLDGARPSNDLPVTGADLDDAIGALLAHRPVTHDQVPSMGCSIKWKPGNEPAYAP